MANIKWLLLCLRCDYIRPFKEEIRFRIYLLKKSPQYLAFLRYGGNGFYSAIDWILENMPILGKVYKSQKRKLLEARAREKERHEKFVDEKIKYCKKAIRAYQKKKAKADKQRELELTQKSLEAKNCTQTTLEAIQNCMEDFL